MLHIYHTYVIAALSFFVPPSVSELPATYKYGTNIGGWLVSEPWMKPLEWAAMGGESCPDATQCAASEWSLARKLGQHRANQAFLKHWQSWFTQDHVNQLKALKLDHVRIPLGFWLVEELVEHPAELYPQGGWMELKRGLRQLRDAGFHVTLDMHALPGVSASNQMFAGNVTSDVQFYKDHNYQRALTWSAVLTSMTHLDPDFSTVVSILCINEPLSDASLTPGLEQYYSDFVTITRIVEYALGIKCEADLQPSIARLSVSKNAKLALQEALPLMVTYAAKGNVTFDPKALQILRKALSDQVTDQTTYSSTDLRKRSSLNELHAPTKHVVKHPSSGSKTCTTTVAMPKRWQWKGNGSSMANYTLGPAAYDDHLYFAYGGVADPNIGSYLSKICTANYYEQAKQLGETPYGHGEFSLATNFNATHDDLRAWGDAQRFMFNQEKYWTFWNFRLGKVSRGNLTQDSVDTWSYLGAVKAGIWPKDPTQYYNPLVCEPYLNNTVNNNSTPFLNNTVNNNITEHAGENNSTKVIGENNSIRRIAEINNSTGK